MASAVPRYQFSPVRICAGTMSTKWPSARLKLQAVEMWRMSESDLNCVSTLIL